MKTILNDNELVKALQKGDAVAFDKLFNKYAGRLYKFGVKYLRNNEDAEGLVQGIFMKVWERRKNLKTETSFQSYIFTVAYHDICNIFRKRKNERHFKEMLILEISQKKAKTDDLAEYKSALEQVYHLISQLPEQQKIAFIKSRKEGLSSKEIATELNITAGTVDNYISAALKFLRSRMDPENLAILLVAYFWVF